MEFTLEEIIEATGAEIIKNETEEGERFSFSTDTRTIKKGDIYLPLKGANFNGEEFIDKAIEAGAVGCFCTIIAPSPKSEISAYLSQNDTQSFCSAESQEEGNHAKLVLQVEDTLTAYLKLARFYKRKINPKTIAITGSSGKTTTKEMAYCVAKEKFKTHKSELNFNNEIGLCKTILAMPEDTEVLILEMGMRGLGEIELLSKYSEPDIAIIANVGTAHLGRLGSRENIAKAKCEIVEYLKPDGLLIAHDDEIIRRQEEKGKRKKISSHLSLLTSHTNYFSLNNTNITDRKIGYSKFEYKQHQYELSIEGDYNVQNALAVIEMGLALKMQEDEIALGLKKYSPIEKRWDVEEIKGYNIINDSYNANPESMKGVIKTVLDIYEPPLVLILGDMGELGKDEVKFHQEIGDFLIENMKNGLTVLTVGELANEITKQLLTADIDSKNFENNCEISKYILDNVPVSTTIVLKASRSMKFEEILAEMKK